MTISVYLIIIAIIHNMASNMFQKINTDHEDMFNVYKQQPLNY